MIIQSLELADFRNYETLGMEFSEGTNIFYGDNAQGKTNILESIYMISTSSEEQIQGDCHQRPEDPESVRTDRTSAYGLFLTRRSVHCEKRPF